MLFLISNELIFPKQTIEDLQHVHGKKDLLSQINI